MIKTVSILAAISIALCIVALGGSDGHSQESDQDAVQWCKDQCVSYHDTVRAMAYGRHLECRKTAVHLEFCDIQYAEELATISSSEELCKEGCEENPK